jgi:hypothetical protein
MPRILYSGGVRSAAALLWAALLASAVFAREDPATRRENITQSHALVTERGVATLPGRIILIREHQHLCAIRFEKPSRARDARAATSFDSGEENFSASYEFRYEDSPDRRFSARAWSGKGEVARGPLRGIGRLVWPSSRARIDCGAIEAMSWYYPSMVWMGDKDSTLAGERRFAPTAWSEFPQVDLQDPRLKWYSHFPGRELQIPLSELPGS